MSDLDTTNYYVVVLSWCFKYKILLCTENNSKSHGNLSKVTNHNVLKSYVAFLEIYSHPDKYFYVGKYLLYCIQLINIKGETSRLHFFFISLKYRVMVLHTTQLWMICNFYKSLNAYYVKII